MRRRPLGKSLVEMLVVITLLSMVMALATTTLTAVFRVKQRLSREAHEEQSLARLASRLRTDAHQAIRCEVADGCALTLPEGETIRYAIQPVAISRQVFRDGAVIHRDAFGLPPNASVAFASEALSGGKLLRLTIRPRQTPGREEPFAHTLSVEAALSLSPRLAGREDSP